MTWLAYVILCILHDIVSVILMYTIFDKWINSANITQCISILVDRSNMIKERERAYLSFGVSLGSPSSKIRPELWGLSSLNPKKQSPTTGPIDVTVDCSLVISVDPLHMFNVDLGCWYLSCICFRVSAWLGGRITESNRTSRSYIQVLITLTVSW